MGHQGMNLDVELLLDKCVIFYIGGNSQVISFRDLLKNRVMNFPNFVLGQQMMVMLTDDISPEEIVKKKMEREAIMNGSAFNAETAIRIDVDMGRLIEAVQNQVAQQQAPPPPPAVKPEPPAPEPDVNGGFDIYESSCDEGEEDEEPCSPSETIVQETGE